MQEPIGLRAHDSLKVCSKEILMAKMVRIVCWVAGVFIAMGLLGCGGANDGATSTDGTSARRTINGTLAGLKSGATVVLQNNRGDELTLGSDGTFTLPAGFLDAATDTVTVLTQPIGQTCTVSIVASTGSAALLATDAAKLNVVCVADAVPTYSVGGTVSGLNSGATLVLRNNGKDVLTLRANGNFSFSTELTRGTPYAVAVLTPPIGQTCTVFHSSGIVDSADVANVSVVCVADLGLIYSIGGTLSGLNSGAMLVLRNNGKDDLTVRANGAFTFSTKLASGAAYAVSVLTQPAGQTCTVSNGTGVINSASVTSVSLACVAAHADCKNCFKKRFVYFGGNITKANLEADADFKKLSDLIPRAAAAGYNGIVLNAGGTGSYDYMVVKPSAYYYSNFAAIVKKASDAGIELIPSGSNPSGIAQVDPTLLEAMPVVDTPFIVSGDTARPVGAQILTNSGFDAGGTGWGFDKSSVSFDSTVSHGGGGSVKFNQSAQKLTATSKMSRLMRSITGLAPHKAYRLSFWIKTSNYDSPLKAMIYEKSGGTPLFYNGNNPLGWSTVGGAWSASPNKVLLNQGWTQYNLDFNTANETAINLYIGAWDVGSASGNAWVDDITITEIGLAHTLQRSSLPISVKSSDGLVVYKIDSDYIIDVEALKIPPGSKIKDGSTLKVSWYQSSKYMTAQYNTPANACSKKYFDIATDVIQKTDALLNHPKGYFMYYDEWRVMNWDPLCGNIDAGTYLKNTTQKVQNILLSVNPNYEMYIWNDMFDPYQNAVDVYWLSNGSLHGAWEGLNSKTTVMNWNVLGGTHQIDSLKFFSDRGFKQMLALYYDDPSLASTKMWLDHLSDAEVNGVTGVEGFMFTGWYGNYDDLEKVANYIKTNYPQYWK